MHHGLRFSTWTMLGYSFRSICLGWGRGRLALHSGIESLRCRFFMGNSNLVSQGIFLFWVGLCTVGGSILPFSWGPCNPGRRDVYYSASGKRRNALVSIVLLRVVVGAMDGGLGISSTLWECVLGLSGGWLRVSALSMSIVSDRRRNLRSCVSRSRGYYISDMRSWAPSLFRLVDHGLEECRLRLCTMLIW